MTLSENTRQAVQHAPIEARIVRKIWKALKDANDRIVSVDDGEEVIHVDTRDEVLEAVFAVDESRLLTRKGGWVKIVLGEEWECMPNYTLSLEDALAPVDEYIEEHMD